MYLQEKPYPKFRNSINTLSVVLFFFSSSSLSKEAAAPRQAETNLSPRKSTSPFQFSVILYGKKI